MAHETATGELPRLVLVVGVAGSGKSTAGRLLADRLGWDYRDADEFHSEANRAKMASGHALTDSDRGPWLEAIGRWMDAAVAARRRAVVTCSALKRSYRDALLAGRPEARLVYLHGSPDLLRSRLAGRHGHFFPAELLESQLTVLQEPEPDEDPVVVEIDQPPEDIVTAVLSLMHRETGSRRHPVGSDAERAVPGGGREPFGAQPVHDTDIEEKRVAGLRAERRADRHGVVGAGEQIPQGPAQQSVDRVVLVRLVQWELQVSTVEVVTAAPHAVRPGDEQLSPPARDGRPGGEPVGDLRLDAAFTGLDRAPDGRAVVRLAHPSGQRGIDLWLGEGTRYVQVYTGDTLAEPERRRRAVAVEAMSCPPDAFRSGTDLTVLEPGATHVLRWGLSPWGDA